MSSALKEKEQAESEKTIEEIFFVESLNFNYLENSPVLKNVELKLDNRPTAIIGQNGAGKTTVLKSIMNMVHTTAGKVEFFGLDLVEHENAIKQRIGYAGGAVDYYKKKKISELIRITKRFYENWDDTVCRKYMDLFLLDENKTPSELSEGMKVKLNLVAAYLAVVIFHTCRAVFRIHTLHCNTLCGIAIDP